MSYPIAFVTNNYTPYSGGVVSSIDATVKKLRDRGYNVYIICPDFLGTKHNDPEEIIRIPSLVRFKYKQNHMMIPWRMKHYLHRALESLRPDLVHIHHPFLLGPLAAAWAKKRGVKTVFTYHTIYEEYLHYLPLPSWLIKPLVTRLVLRSCRLVDQIIAPSSGIKNYLNEQGILNVTIIPSGLKDCFLEQPYRPKEMKKPYQLLYVGRLVKEKNISVLFDLLVQLPATFKLTLVGYGECLDDLKEYAYEISGLSTERVQFIIKPDKQRLCDLYANAHLFLFPSQSDTQGLVIAESMASATPVIALDGIGQRDLIRDGHNGFLVHSLDVMREKILMIAADAHLYKTLQYNAWHTAQAYDPKQLVERLIELYSIPVRSS